MKQLFYPLWSYKNVQVGIPKAPIISSSDGTHFFIAHNEINTPFWEVNTLSPIIKSAYWALGVAYMVIQAGSIPDFWVNIQWKAQKLFNQGVNVFGKNPVSSTWGKPVNFPQKLHETSYSKEYLLRLKEACNEYLKLWRESIAFPRIFLEGVKEFSQNTNEFSAAEEIFTRNKTDAKKKDVIWVNEKFILVIPRKPHLTGFHFQIFPRLKFWDEIGGFRSPWQLGGLASTHSQAQIQGYLEMTAILFGVMKILLKEKNLNFYHPEIHFSGNWNKDLLRKQKGGRLSLDFIQELKRKSQEQREYIIKKEKEKYLVRGIQEFQAVGHGHLYATFSLEEFVKLPSRPPDEAPEEWKRVYQLQNDIVTKIRELLQLKLTSWIEEQHQ